MPETDHFQQPIMTRCNKNKNSCSRFSDGEQGAGVSGGDKYLWSDFLWPPLPVSCQVSPPALSPWVCTTRASSQEEAGLSAGAWTTTASWASGTQAIGPVLLTDQVRQHDWKPEAKDSIVPY